MKFQCNKCKETKDLYKVSFTTVDNDLVCKDAKCCDEYMEQVMTEEYEGLTTNIQRNESNERAFQADSTN